MLRTLKKQGIQFFLSHAVQEAKNFGDKVVVKALNKKDQEVEFDADYCLVAVGRRPYTEGSI